MEIVMLAAGTSSRMGKKNKLLLPWKESTLACHCCLEALSFLEELNEPSNLIVVTGYRRKSLEKSLHACKLFIEKTNSYLTLTIIENREYRKGQLSSAKTGVKQVQDGNDFFICLADMPLLEKKHFSCLVPLLKNNDAVKPFCEKPGHPVLCSSRLKEKILNLSDTSSIKELLSKSKTVLFETEDKAFVTDCDTPEEFSSLV